MPKVTVQVSDKSLDFFHQLMKELKIKVVENGLDQAPDKAAAKLAPSPLAKPGSNGKPNLADAPSLVDAIVLDKPKKAKKKDKGKKKKKHDKD